MKFARRLVWPGKPAKKVYVLPSYPGADPGKGVYNSKVLDEALDYVRGTLKEDELKDQALVIAMASGKGGERQLSVFAYNSVVGEVKNPMIHYQRFNGRDPVQGDGWMPVSEEALQVLEGEIHHRRAYQRDQSALLNQLPHRMNQQAALKFQQGIPLRVAEQVQVDGGGRLYIFRHPDREPVSKDAARTYFAESQQLPGFTNSHALVVGGVYRARTGGLAMDAFGYDSLCPNEIHAFPLNGSDRLDPWSVGVFCETEALLWAAEAKALQSAKGDLESICRSFPEVPREFKA